MVNSQFIGKSDCNEESTKCSIIVLDLKQLLAPLLVSLFLLSPSFNIIYAIGSTHHCATSEDVYEALDAVNPGDTILLQGGTVYEIDESFELNANGTDGNRITFTSVDSTSQGRYAVISTVGQRKEENLVAVKLSGSFWNVSRIEISGREISISEGYWDTYGFRIGLYLLGPGSHDNVVEDIHIHHTHNTAIAIRNESHHNVFRRVKIHHIGEWLDEDYNALEGEGFYIGSSKGISDGGQKAVANYIVIEECILGPRLLGQYIDIKYAASFVTARNNVLYCYEKSYNEEIVKLAGFANVIEDNEFVGSHENLTRYLYILNNNPSDPVRVDHLGQQDIPAPTGRDNVVVNNVFYTNESGIEAVYNNVAPIDRPTVVVEDNLIEPLEAASYRGPARHLFDGKALKGSAKRAAFYTPITGNGSRSTGDLSIVFAGGANYSGINVADDYGFIYASISAAQDTLLLCEGMKALNGDRFLQADRPLYIIALSTDGYFVDTSTEAFFVNDQAQNVDLLSLTQGASILESYPVTFTKDGNTGLPDTFAVQGFIGVSTTLQYNESDLTDWTALETRIPDGEDILTFEIEPEDRSRQGFYRVVYERQD